MATPVVRKISDTIMAFGEPLISQIDIEQPEERVHGVFEHIIGIWNASVMATPRWGQPHFLVDLQDRLRDPQLSAEVGEMHRLLTERRATHFAKDLRAVGTWSIHKDGNGWRLRCDARVPPLK